MNIRRAAPADIAGLVDSSRALFLEDAGTRDPIADLSWPDRHAAESFTAGLDDPTRLLLVLDDDGTVAGHLSGRIEEPNAFVTARTAVLRSFHIAPEHRSRGLGAQLVAEFSDWAEAAGAEVLEVTANAANERGLGFYRSAGFEPQSVLLRRAVGPRPS